MSEEIVKRNMASSISAGALQHTTMRCCHQQSGEIVQILFKV
jgi:hypothetical protein